MSTVEIEEGKFSDIIARIPPDTPIVMLNLLRFADIAEYPGGSEMDSCSGRDAYMKRYIVPAKPYLRQVGGESIYQSEVSATLLGAEDEQWDVMTLYRYPSIGAFVEMVTGPDYLELRKHREAALSDSRLIATIEAELYEN
jgi:uncharacterized protein (DUF1330 family)